MNLIIKIYPLLFCLMLQIPFTLWAEEINPESDSTQGKQIIKLFDERSGKELEMMSGEILVKFKKSINSYSIKNLHTKLGTTVQDEITELNIQLITLPADMTIAQAIELYRQNPNVEIAEPNYVGHQCVVPNDHFYPQQWYLPHINAEQAWDLETGNSNVIIGILDTGVDTDHPDLSSKIWTNPGETPGNGIDDDNNGYIDDVHGWDFVTTGHNAPADNDPNPEPNGIDDDDDGEIDNGCNHGTHVAGIVAAETNTNKVGVAGLGWGVTIMPVRVGDDEGNFSYSDIFWGLLYAGKNGAKVINCSFGGPYSDIFDIMISYLYNDLDCIIIASAGNKNIDLDQNLQSPVCNDGHENRVVGVAATDRRDIKANFSNYSASYVDVSAPGVDIYNSFFYDLTFNFNVAWENMSGTSMSAPIVAGIAGLIRSRYPTWNNRKVMDQIISTTVNIDGLNSGHQGELGTGRVDAYAALKSVLSPTQISCSANPIVLPSNGTSTAIITSKVQDQNGQIIFDATNQITFTITSGAASAQLIGPNPVNAVNGIATITLQSTTIPGIITIEARSPGLRSGSTSISTFNTFTEVGGDITTQEIWTLANSPYRAIRDVFVHGGGSLTIEPGVVILFNSGTGLKIAGESYHGDRGSLQAEGNSTIPVTFTSASGKEGDWKGILFDSDSDREVNSILHYCIIENAGQANAYGINANIYCRNTNTPAISNCTIRNSSGYGIYLQTSAPAISNNTISNSSKSEIIYLNSSTPTINGNTIIGNGSLYWLYCVNSATNPTLTNNTFSGNVTRTFRLGTNFQMSGNSLSGASNMSMEVWGGDLNTTRVWRRQAGSAVYKIVTFDLFVRGNGVLTVEPGLTLLFNSGTGLRIAGDSYHGDRAILQAEGSAINPITFTSTSGNVGDWKGMLFDSDSDREVNSILDYCIIENAGQSNAYGINANIYCRNTNTPAISNCTIRNSSGYGIYLQASSPAISNNTISNTSPSEIFYLDASTATLNGNAIIGNSSLYWLYCATSGTNPTLTNNTFSGNVTRTLRLGTNFQMSGNSLRGASDKSMEVWGGDLNTTRVWRPQTGSSVYKIVTFDLFIHSNGILTIEPGLALLFSSGTGLRIAGDSYHGDRGSLYAEGNAANPITFTSASGNVGDWKGILFDSDSDREVSSTLKFCIVEKAGQANARNINSAIYCRYSNTPTLTNCSIQNNGAAGLDFDYASPPVTKCKIINNAGYGIYCRTSSQPTIGNAEGTTNDIYGNGGYDVYVSGADNINARYNYWGTVNVAQINARIYDKHDNPASGEVFYTPWATESGGGNKPPTAFSLVLPLNNATVKTLTPSLSWQKSYDNDGSSNPVYTIQVGLQPDFIKDYYEFYNITGETYTLSQSLANLTRYYWRVKATDEEGAFIWSNEIWSFFIDPGAHNNPPFTPSILYPDSGEATPGDYLVWTKSSDPDAGDVITYTLELDNNSDFTSPEIHQPGITGDSGSEKTLLPGAATELNTQNSNAIYIRIISLTDYANLKDDTIYYWRVKTVDNAGAASDFTSGASHFFFNKTNTAPHSVSTGFSPASGLEVRTNKPTLAWTAAIDPDLSDHQGKLHYKVQLDDDGEFNTNYEYQYITLAGQNTYQVPDSLKENQHWYYRIKTIDDEGLESGWSTISDFWVNGWDEQPGPFALSSPTNGSMVASDSVLFTWQVSNDPDPNDNICYRLELSSDSLFIANIIEFDKLLKTSYSLQVNQLPATRTYWRVRAIDSDGLERLAQGTDTRPWWIAKATAVNESSDRIPKYLKLYPSYPNPFNNSTTISFDSPKITRILLEIYNSLGQKVITLFDEKCQPGHYSFVWNGLNENDAYVGTGLYFVKLSDENNIQMQKLVLIK